MNLDLASKVADAVLFEGYVLYPYRASAAKNQLRWQFGVLVPRAWSEAGGGEPWASQTDCLIEAGENPVLHVRLRFLQVQARRVERVGRSGVFEPVDALEVDGSTLVGWDEGVVREVDAVVPLGTIGTGNDVGFELPGGEEVEPVNAAGGALAGRVLRRRWPLSGVISVVAERVDGPFPLVRVRVRGENATPWGVPDAGRDEALRRSLVGAHTLLGLTGGRFVSLLDPPAWARAAAAACDNQHTWPVLVGERRNVMLSSPIILYDHPEVAPESPGDLFDATEIDEILTLRTMALTEGEKREARATDERAAAIVDRADTLPPDLLARLHGAVRSLRRVTGAQADQERPPWWDPAADASVSPGSDSVRVGGVALARGSRVRLRPGMRRADAQDMFLDGRVATVEAVLSDVDGERHLAVTLDDDPAAELHRWHGRFLYFAPDEVEPLPPDREGRPG
jgi:hypothetical protein